MESNPLEAPLASGTPNGAQLSEREHEILRLVATGASNKQIAQQLVISPNTVKVHLRNIFGKIGVATRTEAALYAIREGLVQVTSDVRLPAEEPEPIPVMEAVPTNPQPLPDLPVVRPQPAIKFIIWPAAILAIVILILAMYVFDQRLIAGQPPTQPATTAVVPRWRALASLPTARSDLAAVTYDNQIYITGGNTPTGVTGATDRYDPATNTWTNLAPKPLPVTDVQAAVVGGLIFVPGGLAADNKPVKNLEVYDPRQDRWEQRAPLPTALSAYALVAFEGRLLLFGGWDGQGYQAVVYAYSPTQDTWTQLTSMPVTRAFAGAAVAADRIYVLGGMNNAGALSRNDEYVPENEGTATSPWQARAPLPQARYSMGVAGLADNVNLVGGTGATVGLSSLRYYPQTDQWLAFEPPPTQDLTGIQLAAVDKDLHLIGGRPTNQTAPVVEHLSYQAIFTIEIPIMH